MHTCTLAKTDDPDVEICGVCQQRYRRIPDEARDGVDRFEKINEAEDPK